MVQINFAQKQVNAKIVFYGPGMSGKTTNLEIVHQRAPAPNRGDLTSISTDGDRTLFFDFMPLDLGTVAGMRTCFQIYTVPGQVYYNSTRKLVLQGVDGVVFVADSSAAMIEENLESMRNLEQNLAEYGKNLATIPLIIQYNKRDLPDAMSVDELNRHLNPYNAPFFEAIANTGQGVFPTLKALAARVLESIHTGAKTTNPAPISSGQTGYYPQSAVPTQAPAPQSQPAPVSYGAPQQLGAPQQRPLQQTGYFAGAQQQQPQQQQQRPAPMPAMPAFQQPMPAAAQQQGMHGPQGGPMQGYADPLARTTVHAPPPLSMPPMQPMQPMQPPPMQQQPMQQQMPMQHMPQPMHGGMAPMQPQPMQPMQPMQPQLHQTGYGFAPQQPQAPQRGAPMVQQAEAMQSTMATGTLHHQQQQQQQTQAQNAALHMLRVDKNTHAPAPANTPRARALPTARAGAPTQEAAPRIQPRSAPLPTPSGSGKRRMMYVGLFVVVALGVGAVVAKIVLKLF
jgi:signal recognition particle receptor subunit beta